VTPVLPYREKVIACERGGTFKYFLAADRVQAVWAALSHAYGEVRRDPAMATIEISCAAFIIRSTTLGNPITVMRKRACTDADVAALHLALEFSDERTDP
jgi:hypothetical protein